MWRLHHLQSESQTLFTIFSVHMAGAACVVRADNYSNPSIPVLGSPARVPAHTFAGGSAIY